MEQSIDIVALLQPLFAAYDVALTPASESSLRMFRARAAEHAAPDAVVAQLTDFYSVVDGVPCLDSLDIFRCDDPIIFEWWGQRELWLGQRDDATLRWSLARGAFCIGDASNVSFSADDEHPTFAVALRHLLSRYD
jgi:hypothetical protein